MHANRQEDVSEVFAGDIAAAIGFKHTFTGDSLCDPTHPVVLESIRFPEPVVSRAIEPKTKEDQDRLGESLRKLSEEDPTFRTRYDDETGQTIISGMGELHLEVIADRLLREFRVEASVGRPQGAYQEGIPRRARAGWGGARAPPGLREPIMKLEIRTPEEFFGDVLGDINGRRGHILGVEARGKLQIVRALVPLAESFGYTTD